MPLYIPSPEPPVFVGNKRITGTLTIGGQILVADGSVALPSIARGSDGRTGWYFFSDGNGAHIASAVNPSSQGVDFAPQWMRLYDGYPIHFGTGRDVSIQRLAAGQLGIGNPAANGQLLGVKQLAELTTIAAAATTDTTIQLPANALVLGVSSRVTVQPPGTTTTDIGIAGATTRYGTGISTVVGTTNPGTAGGVLFNPSAVSVRYTPNATPSDATGRIRTTVHVLELTPATS